MISTLEVTTKKRKLDLESEEENEEEKQSKKKQKLIDGSSSSSFLSIVSFPEPVMRSLKPPYNTAESKKQRNKKNRRLKQEQMFEQREARRLLERDNRIYCHYTICIPGRDAAINRVVEPTATIDFDSRCSSDHCTSSEHESNETEKDDGDDSLGTIWVLHPKFGKKVRRSARLRALQQY